MTQYRIVTRHVRYWRGAIHRWSNVYPFVGTLTPGNYGAALNAMYTMEQALGFQHSSGATQGGCYELALYDQGTGGIPVAVQTKFPWATPGSWIAYTSSAWADKTIQYESVAEVAMSVEWPAGLSKSGKPVYFRKWYHSVPVGSGGGTADISAPNIATITTALETGLNAVGGLGAPMGSGSRLAASTPIVNSFYCNHQMPRGRRRKAASPTVQQNAAILQLIESQLYKEANGE